MDGVAGDDRHRHRRRTRRGGRAPGADPRRGARRGVAGGCVGFLVYNWHPASIFMGDAGSLFLGLPARRDLAQARWSTGYGSSITAVVLIMFPAVFDTTLVVISRTRAGRSIMVGGTDHTSHRLNRLGLPIRWVAFSLGLFAIIVRQPGSDGRPRRRSPARRVRARCRRRRGGLRAASAACPCTPTGAGRLSACRRRRRLTRLVDETLVELCVSSTSRCSPKSRSARSAAARPIRARRSGSRSEAVDGGSERRRHRPARRSQSTPSATTSRTAPTSVATAGTPCIAASIRATGIPSLSLVSTIRSRRGVDLGHVSSPAGERRDSGPPAPCLRARPATGRRRR